MTAKEQAETILSADYYGTPEEQGKKRAEDLAVLIESASLAGAEDMRERAVRIVEAFSLPEILWYDNFEDVERSKRSIAKSIRSLTPTSNVIELSEARGRLEEAKVWRQCNHNPETISAREFHYCFTCQRLAELAADLKRLEEFGGEHERLP